MRIAEQSQANAFREVFSIWPEYQEAKHLKGGPRKTERKKKIAQTEI